VIEKSYNFQTVGNKFSATQILREINLGLLEMSRTVTLAILEGFEI